MQTSRLKTRPPEIDSAPDDRATATALRNATAHGLTAGVLNAERIRKDPVRGVLPGEDPHAPTAAALDLVPAPMQIPPP